MSVLDAQLLQDRIRLVDVGAREGVDPRWRRFESYLEVIAFEPDPAECDRLNRAAASRPYPARFLPYALSRERKDDVPFYVCRWEVASSLYPPNQGFLQSFPLASALLSVKKQRRISTVRLDDVTREEGLVPDCVKIDVEGAELDVIEGGRETLGTALVLEVEAEFNPIFEGQPLFADIDRYLRDRGWTLLGLRRNCWRRGKTLNRDGPGEGGQLVAADVLYLSPAAAGGELALARELKLLVILAAYMQLDLVMERLDDSAALGRHLSAGERAELAATLIPRKGPVRRLAIGALRRFDSQRRREFADRLQPGDATVWQDPHFY